MGKVSKKLLDLMNDGIAREMQVSIQYMWQHVACTGLKSLPVKDIFKNFAITEMKHAEKIAERLTYLGGIPTIKPTPIVVGKKLKEMIAQEIKDEEGAIVLYRQIIELAEKEGDHTSALIFRQILQDEEEHHDTFTSLMEDL